MYATGDVLVYETVPQTIAGMVQKIREKKQLNPRHRFQSQDSIPTEIVTQLVYGTTEILRKSGIRRPKHRDEPIEASRWLPAKERIARHVSVPFRRPVSLAELLRMEF